jgi:hypothetical protein
MRHFWRISWAVASSRSRSVRLCYKNARSVTSGQDDNDCVARAPNAKARPLPKRLPRRLCLQAGAQPILMQPAPMAQNRAYGQLAHMSAYLFLFGRWHSRGLPRDPIGRKTTQMINTIFASTILYSALLVFLVMFAS